MNKKQLLPAILISFLIITPVLAQDNSVEGELLDNKKKAEILFERGKSLFEEAGYIFSLRTTTNYVLEAIELDSDNKKYKEFLCNLYDSYWEDSDDVDNRVKALRREYESGEYVGTKENFEMELSLITDLDDLQKKIKAIVEEFRNNK